VLSLVSGLLIRSLYEVQRIDLGFKPQNVISFQVNLPTVRYKEPFKQTAFFRLAAEKLTQLPGMESVSGISGLPLTTQGEVNRLEVGAQSPFTSEPLQVEYESILPGFFRTMRLPMLEGRDFTDADRDGAPTVVILDNVLAAKLWQGQNPLGKQVRMSARAGGTSRPLEVVGIVQEIKHFGPEAKVRWMQVYVPQYQDPSSTQSFVLNAAMPEAAVKPAIDKVIHELDKDLPIENFQTMDTYLDNYLSPRRVSILLLSAFAGTGIVLGMIGIYGVVAAAVLRRRREIAIRMAMGATVPGTMILLVRLGLTATLGGILIGSAIVMSLARLLGSLLFGISALNPALYLLCATVIASLALVASLVPAMRLFRFNIQEILRQ
jgi:putative ABC transport system permease protein